MVSDSVRRQREMIAEMRSKGKESRPRRLTRTGPGSQLKAVIGWVPLLVPWWDSAGCLCNKIANQMDHFGADWCEQHKNRLVKQIHKSAAGGGVEFPGMDLAIRKLIEWAIWRDRHAKTMPDRGPDDLPCVHRTAKTEDTGCRGCNGRFAVFGCSLYNQCTIVRVSPGIAACESCMNRREAM